MLRNCESFRQLIQMPRFLQWDGCELLGKTLLELPASRQAAEYERRAKVSRARAPSTGGQRSIVHPLVGALAVRGIYGSEQVANVAWKTPRHLPEN